MATASGWHRAIFALTVFLSAFLLFQVQPLIGKYILPWFGGSPSVWTVCMLFFQALLFFGYGYAHLITRVLPAKLQAAVHVGLLLAVLFFLPIAPSDRWQTTVPDDPTWHILLLLGASIGLPYLLLSSTGPLLQAWYARVSPQRSPYPLYALSNLGSLLALVSYPFALEPACGVHQQAVIWSWAFLAFAAGCSACAFSLGRLQMPAEQAVDRIGSPAGVTAARPRAADGVMWFVLAMVPSVMLLATTNQVCTDLAVIPFLWVLPLSLYLLSFILCFQSLRWCQHWIWLAAWALAVIAAMPVMYKGLGAITSRPLLEMAAYFSLLFCGAMFCHGELARSKPDPRYLTSFYLTLAAGGAAGGIFVGLIAPVIFPVYAELSVAIVACTAVMLIVLARDRAWMLVCAHPRRIWLGLILILLVVVGVQVDLFRSSLGGVQSVQRNFFGVLQVKLHVPGVDREDAHWRLIHGRTLHGLQFLAESKQGWPTSYYGEDSGIGLVLRSHRAGQSRRIGVVGLGVGTLAAYGRKGDRLCFYEINPAVIDLAQRSFGYLPQCKADCKVVAGDARVSLDREESQQFDILALDAFSSDAIPLHLLTREAWTIYLRHLKPDGVLAVHISNVHLDLKPVIAGHAEQFGLEAATVPSSSDEQRGTKYAVWALLSRDPAALQIEAIQTAKLPPTDRKLFWTDDRNSLFQVLKD